MTKHTPNPGLQPLHWPPIIGNHPGMTPADEMLETIKTTAQINQMIRHHLADGKQQEETHDQADEANAA